MDGGRDGSAEGIDDGRAIGVVVGEPGAGVGAEDGGREGAREGGDDGPRVGSGGATAGAGVRLLLLSRVGRKKKYHPAAPHSAAKTSPTPTPHRRRVSRPFRARPPGSWPYRRSEGFKTVIE